jgi:PKD repeat protein
MDGVGNSTTKCSSPYQIDKTAPTATLSADTSTCEQITWTISGASDSLSGLHSTPYSFDNGSTWQSSNTYTETITGGGSSTITAKVRDKALNEWSDTQTVNTEACVTPDFSISLSPTSQSVTQGTSANYDLAINPSGGFSSNVGSWSVQNCPTGASCTVNPSSCSSSNYSTCATLTITTSALSPNTYSNIKVQGTGGGFTRTSNTVDLTVTAPIIPDLIVQDITWTPSTIKAGDTVNFTFTLKNQGTGDASSFVVKYYIDGSYVGQDSISSLSAGTTKATNFSWTATCGHTHEIKAIADANNDVSESNENNNELIKTLSVENCAPGAFNLLAPSNNATSVSVSPTLDWEDSVDPDGDTVTYYLYFCQGQSCTPTATGDSTTQSQYNLSNLLAGTWYGWDIVAYDGTSTVVSSNGPFYFQTTSDICVPSPPQSPPVWSCNADGTVDITWDWSPGVGADDYELQVDTDSNFSNPLTFDQWVGNVTQYTTQNLSAPATYYGRVRAQFNSGPCIGSSDWSDVTQLNVQCNQSPVADFSYCLESANVVRFTDLSSDSDGSITAWNWDFGDGTTSTEQNPIHTYPAIGFGPQGETLASLIPEAKAQSWGTVFFDDFNDGDYAGWQIIDINGKPYDWSVISGAVRERSDASKSILISPYNTNDSSYQINVRAKNTGSANNAIAVVFGYKDKNNYYRFEWYDPINYYGAVKRRIVEVKNGSENVLVQDTGIAMADNTWYDLSVLVDGGQIQAIVNGVPVLTANASPQLLGSGLYTYDNDGGVWYDDYAILTPPSGGAGQDYLNVNFNSSTDGFVYYDDLFRNTNNPDYAKGWRDTSQGHTGASLYVCAGDCDDLNNDVVNGMSGGWRRSFSISDSPQAVEVSLWYKLLVPSPYEPEECGEALVAIDGVTYGTAGSVDANCGGYYNSGWRKYTFTVKLGNGSHTIDVGAYNNKQTYINEQTEVWIDDIKITKATVSSPAPKPVEFFDPFFDNSDTSLASHNPQNGGGMGSGWYQLVELRKSGTATLTTESVGDYLRKGTCSYNEGTLYETADMMSSPDYEVSILQSEGGSSDDYNILAARIQDANNMYAFNWNTKRGQLYKRVNGSWYKLGSQTSGIANSSKITLKVEGNTISALDDGVVISSVNDSDITSAGRAGIGMGAVIVSGSDCTNQQLDDFQVAVLETLILNNPPNTPLPPSGPTTGNTSTTYTFSTSGTDPDGDSLQYRFDWGDGTISNYGSSTQSYAWSSAGTYQIKAQAKDTQGAESNWSSPSTIDISTPPPTSYNVSLTVADNDGATSTVLKTVDLLSATYCASNQNPQVSNLSATKGDYCSSPSHFFSWTYLDPDGDTESKFQFQVDNNSDFSSPEIDRTFDNLSNPSGTDNSQVVFVTSGGGADRIDYNTTYYWRVKVFDSKGGDSGWVQGAPFATEKHQYPIVDFSWTPQFPALEEVTTFTPQVQTFGGSTVSSWNWTFQDGTPATSASSTPQVTFSTSGDKQVTLQATDSDGYSCSTNKVVKVGFPLPKWKEVTP